MKPPPAALLLAALAAALWAPLLTAQVQQPDPVPRAGAIRAALRRDPNNPTLHLELGRLYRRHWSPLFKVEGEIHLRDAVRLARARRDRATEAEGEYELARAAWLRYETFGHRYRLVGSALQIDPIRTLEDWRYVEQFFATQAIPDSFATGEGVFRDVESRARAALAAVPGHLGAARLLATALGDHERWEEIILLGRTQLALRPADPEGWRMLGLAFQRTGRSQDATRAFDSALARMGPDARRPYENLAPILRRADAERWNAMDPAQRAELRRLYWESGKPLLLDTLNPLPAELYARLTYADYRWTAPEESLDGIETDRGVTYVRYGPPDIRAVFSEVPAGSENTILEDHPLIGGETIEVWAYRRSRLRFIFQHAPGFARATYAAEFPYYAQQVRELAPVRFDNLAAVRDIDTIATQTAQFRGPAGGTSVAVYAFVPLGRMARDISLRRTGLEVGATVRDGRLREAGRRVRNEIVSPGDSAQQETRFWRFDLAPSSYLLRVEAKLGASNASARAALPVDVERFSDAFAISDVVLADRVSPRDSAPQRWTDYLIDPSAGILRTGQPFSLLWEVYNLRGDTAGVGRYRVQLDVVVRTVERGVSEGGPAPALGRLIVQVIGGIGDAAGLTREGDAQVSLSFERDVDLRGREAVPQHLDVELRDAPGGRYVAQLTVTDITSNRSATRVREFIVTARRDPMPRRFEP